MPVNECPKKIHPETILLLKHDLAYLAYLLKLMQHVYLAAGPDKENKCLTMPSPWTYYTALAWSIAIWIFVSPYLAAGSNMEHEYPTPTPLLFTLTAELSGLVSCLLNHLSFIISPLTSFWQKVQTG